MPLIGSNFNQAYTDPIQKEADKLLRSLEDLMHGAEPHSALTALIAAATMIEHNFALHDFAKTIKEKIIFERYGANNQNENSMAVP